ncbi:cytochrome P450 [Pseudooceanicola sediminis]|uniref:Cytochrome P450 n=1 Tax=Pseudooceanicola sediminis TaxID=2211117 RepID=A0A399JCX2_9RHOB|nr:cytochrome P450 [Pseudooceanicola sediminis]KAA2317163.1 cytochrome P450 [Puniceibacterium sp. HSS470]RII40486.1 cytochrome P450 [Pseudooceanicola sediminis]|tara:strand:+ start:76765 stop:78129 length:1365 start_codon:yes stop_codon:yes gene_type:complete
MTPPKPPARDEAVSLWRYARLFRADILSAQPARLYRAWMAEFRTPFFRSYLINQPDLVRRVLQDRPGDFPKSDRVGEGLRPLLGNAVFLSNGATWRRQRRIIDPAFEGGQLRARFPAMQAAAEACAARLDSRVGEALEIEAETSHAAADVIFRALFSIPIEHSQARAVFDRFRQYQRSQPVLNLAALVPLPRWMPRYFPRAVRRAGHDIRALVRGLVEARLREIRDGVAPDDLATRIMTTPDPDSGQTFEAEEMVDQVAIFFLAGHETSASALAWALYLLATHPDWQEAVAVEVAAAGPPEFAGLSRLGLTRDVFREALRLYPPVPMMVREASQSEVFRNRSLRRGAQVVLSPWHLHRHVRLWQDPDGFDPGRWQSEAGRHSQRAAYIPFSAGPRVCPGAGFAMIEGVVLLAEILRRFHIEAVPGRVPEPVAHLTLRSRNGIWLRLTRREDRSS